MKPALTFAVAFWEGAAGRLCDGSTKCSRGLSL
jgi:hypothetical protein